MAFHFLVDCFDWSAPRISVHMKFSFEVKIWMISHIWTPSFIIFSIAPQKNLLSLLPYNIYMHSASAFFIRKLSIRITFVLYVGTKGKIFGICSSAYIWFWIFVLQLGSVLGGNTQYTHSREEAPVEVGQQVSGSIEGGYPREIIIWLDCAIFNLDFTYDLLTNGYFCLRSL